jgi:DNA-binding LytR/AlgR family response regulator
MLHIAICDDNNAICAYLINFIQANFPEYNYKIHDFSSGTELLREIKEENQIYNLILLDLLMNGGDSDGIPTAAALRQLPSHRDAMIMFITSHDAPPSPIVDVHPFAYLKKPIQPDDLHRKLNAAFHDLDNRNPYVLIPKFNDGIRVNTDSIYYIQAQSRKCNICFEKDSFSCNQKLRQIFKIIKPVNPMFIQTHTSYVVNLKYLKVFYADRIVLTNDAEIPISRSYHDEVLIQYSNLIPKFGRL